MNGSLQVETKPMIYAYPVFADCDLGLFRFGGAGLGNLLFPWARCQLVAQQRGWRVIAATWPSLKPLRWLRNDPDKRFYHRLFRAEPGSVQGLAKLLALRCLPRCRDEAGPSGNAAGESRADSTCLVEFRGMEGMFAPLTGAHRVVAQRLDACLHRSLRRALAQDDAGALAIHVRLGDFVVNSDMNRIQQGASAQRVPLDWYARALAELRRRVGRDAPALIYSDGRDAELSPLLALPGVRRAPMGDALLDMLRMSRSRGLVASGSTFSMWASYLGRMPVVWPRGQLRQRLYAPAEGVPEWELD
jgi:hypothetical protein